MSKILNILLCKKRVPNLIPTSKPTSLTPMESRMVKPNSFEILEEWMRESKRTERNNQDLGTSVPTALARVLPTELLPVEILLQPIAKEEQNPEIEPELTSEDKPQEDHAIYASTEPAAVKNIVLFEEEEDSEDGIVFNEYELEEVIVIKPDLNAINKILVKLNSCHSEVWEEVTSSIPVEQFLQNTSEEYIDVSLDGSTKEIEFSIHDFYHSR